MRPRPQTALCWSTPIYGQHLRVLAGPRPLLATPTQLPHWPRPPRAAHPRPRPLPLTHLEHALLHFLQLPGCLVTAQPRAQTLVRQLQEGGHGVGHELQEEVPSGVSPVPCPVSHPRTVSARPGDPDSCDQRRPTWKAEPPSWLMGSGEVAGAQTLMQRRSPGINCLRLPLTCCTRSRTPNTRL